MTLSPAESALIELLRSGKPFNVSVMLPEVGGQWVVSTTAPPFGKSPVDVGMAVTFEQAWAQRITTLVHGVAPGASASKASQQ